MERYLDILEFNHIKEQLIKYNINDLSLKMVEELHPYFYYEEVLRELDKTKEAYEIINQGALPSLGQLEDVSEFLDKVSKNAILNLIELSSFIRQQEVILNLKKYLKDQINLKDKLTYFTTYVDSLNYISEVYEQLTYCIGPNYTIKDDASSKLKNIRKEISNLESSIKIKLNSILKDNAAYLSDLFIASRGEHLCLPVKAEYKNKIKGVVIDTSSTRSTYFIEPYSVIESNIRLEQLHADEEAEIFRIIKALCTLINKHNETLKQDNDILKELSFMMLKGSYGINNKYEIASLYDDNFIELVGAKHPLIAKDKVVANDFYLGKDNNNIIVISGPNAGGKTVALKTVALLIVMNQAGLPIPVKSANLGVFSDIFVDIGDEQSIEQSLSGFTSHMVNITHIIDNVNEHSLVILDELGSRTDPSEGEALARAIIEYLASKKAIALVTTHYLKIKDFANDNTNITLASMGFDKKTLNPTYNLLLNTIGRSYAFEISSRLGLKQEIINKAKSYKEEKSDDLDKIIDELSASLKLQNDKINAINELENDLKQKEIDLAIRSASIEKKENKLKEDLALEREKLIEEAKEEINAIVEEFKQNNKENYKLHLKNNALNKLDEISTDKEVQDEEIINFKVGDLVSVNDVCKGIIKEINGDKVKVSTNTSDMYVNKNELKLLKDKKTYNKEQKIRINQQNPLKSIPLSINLIGMHVDEALIELRQYIDACYLASYSEVSVIHGHGTGTLRKACQEYLASCKLVDSYRLGNYYEGSTGVTIVTLKKR